jgi:hypothetical protein
MTQYNRWQWFETLMRRGVFWKNKGASKILIGD